MNQNTEKQRLTSLLALKSAPQGKIDGDFKVALYAVAALYQLDFSKTVISVYVQACWAL